MASIIYKNWKFDIFQHADWCNRWFNGLVDLSSMADLHGRKIIGSDGTPYVFRQAVFEGFKRVKSGIPMYIVECPTTCEVWILCPNWINQLKVLTLPNCPHKPQTYRDILNFIQLFYADGDTMKRLINNGRIQEINKQKY